MFPTENAIATCLSGGTEIEINLRLTEVGSVALLCPNSIFRLNGPIRIMKDHQELATEGAPAERNLARVVVSGSNLSSAIVARASYIRIHHIYVDGQRPDLGRLKDGEALIEVGGSVTANQVDHVVALNPRGWSTLHVFEGDGSCTGAVIENNEIGPAGAANGEWADGISLACRNSGVRNNIITDASDGGIVIFGAPGSTIEKNLVETQKNVLLGGINLVDYKPFDGDYRGTIVRRNRIVAHGGYIKVGIAIGPSVWGDDNKHMIRGAAVLDNEIGGYPVGYGIAVDGAQEVVITGNRDRAEFTGRRDASCFPETVIPGFRLVRNFRRSSGRFQPEFEDQVVRYAICIRKDE